MGPSTNIFGISTSDELLFLSDDTILCSNVDPGVCSDSQTTFLTKDIRVSCSNAICEPYLKEIVDITAVGGIYDGVEEGIFVVSGNCGDSGSPCKVYNVYFDNGWKAEEILNFPSDCPQRKLCGVDPGTSSYVYFGSYNGKVYMLDGMMGGTSYISEFTFVGGNDRYNFVEVSSGGQWDTGRRLCSCYNHRL